MVDLIPDWHDQALCKDLPSAWAGADFYPENRRSAGAKLAKQVCGVCPTRLQCLDSALSNNEKHGIWGGTDPTERNWLSNPEVEVTRETAG